ncbi:hypothetical protein GO755_05405 [Spirosoma sp. HMF4905]|uniref:Uncharacterized protein n=1 Tax=Spirosoma arboris TaxID=2682092 RepID=A0A7K1S6K5_9BACT|nr:hypothetical protein [Spirosoma arboris]MVM29459.1 hypothetical protein [Spirosoma arboris]
MAQPDVFKILSDLEYKAVGVDPHSQKKPEGSFISFRPIGLPIRKSDYSNPWTPFGAEMKKILSDAKKDAGPTPQPNADGTLPPASPVDLNALVNAGIGQSFMNYVNTFYLTNNKLYLENAYRENLSAGKVDDAWYAVINGAQSIAPKADVNDSIKHIIQDAQAKLQDTDGNPTPHFSAYVQYRDAYNDKVRTLNRAYADALSNPTDLQRWPITGKSYQSDVDFAWQQWMGFGFKIEVETAMNILAGQGQNPALLLITRAKQKWENSLVHFDKVGDLPYTFMTPRDWYDQNGGGWMTYSSSDFHSESHFKNESSSFSAGGGFSLGFWSAGADVKSSSELNDMKLKTTGLDISFSYCVADVVRPWMDTTLLNLDNWFLVGNYKKNCISDGTINQVYDNHSDNSTFLPSVVTSIILISNLTIKWSEANTQRTVIDKAISTGGSVGWGPFSVHASYSDKNHKDDSSYDFISGGLRVNGVQMIGSISTILPASPRHNSSEFMSATAATTGVKLATPAVAVTH